MTSPKTAFMISEPNCLMPRSNSVSGARALRRAAMSPNAVLTPVATTRAVAVPLTTEVPSSTIVACDSSPALNAFSTGIDSPVSADSCTWRSFVSSSRASAGTRSPALSRITSPGTTEVRSTSANTPLRNTVAVGATVARRRSAAC